MEHPRARNRNPHLPQAYQKNRGLEHFSEPAYQRCGRNYVTDNLQPRFPDFTMA